MILKENIVSFMQKTPAIAPTCYVDSSAKIIGDVALSEDASVWPGAVLRGDVQRITVGARSNVQDLAVCHVTHDGPYSPGGLPLKIGEDVTVGHHATLHACTIGDRVLVGMGAIVMDKAVLEADVMLAAGSLVPPGKRLASGWLYKGNPAVAVRELTVDEVAMLKYSAEHYVRLKNNYLEMPGL